MFHSFSEIEDYLLKSAVRKRVALAGCQDPDALASIVCACKKGLVEMIGFGKIEKTKQLLRDMGEHPEDYELYDVPDGAEAARSACRLVFEGQADLPMKGQLQTAEFMRAVLDKSLGFFKEGSLLSQATVMEFPEENRLILISDCAINITPGYAEKIKIIENAVKLAGYLRIEMPKVAVVCPVEVVNPKMPSTIEAAMLSKAAQRGQIKGCLLDGPLGLDNAINMHAATGKGIVSEVAGCADILIMPDLASGNIFSKAINYFAHLSSSGSVCGTEIGVIMTSRTDTPEDKYNSILVALLQSVH